jgi:hypothetical protein
MALYLLLDPQGETNSRLDFLELLSVKHSESAAEAVLRDSDNGIQISHAVLRQTVINSQKDFSGDAPDTSRDWRYGN